MSEVRSTETTKGEPPDVRVADTEPNDHRYSGTQRYSGATQRVPPCSVETGEEPVQVA